MELTVIIPTIVADQEMLDRAILKVRWHTPDAEVIVPSDGSFAENCNRGAQLASHEILIFLNDDTEVQAGWWQPLAYTLEAGDGMIAGSRLIYPDGSLQHAGIDLRVINGALHGVNRQTEQPSGEVDAVTGACLAVRAVDFHTLGGFDPGFINGNEDVDLCLRARALGGRVIYCENSTVIHHESRSGPARWAHVGQNVARLNELWKVNVD